MTGYNTVLMIKRIEERCKALGLRLGSPKYEFNEERVGVYPADDALPIFSRDTQLFCASIEGVEMFLCGVEWARKYDDLLIKGNDKRRTRKEQDYRNDQLARKLSTEVKQQKE